MRACRPDLSVPVDAGYHRHGRSRAGGNNLEAAHRLNLARPGHRRAGRDAQMGDVCLQDGWHDDNVPAYRCQ